MPRVGSFDFLRNIDNFGEAVPSFNIGGRAEIKTISGGIVTLIIFLVTFSFGVMKMQHLLEKKNPVINTNEEPLEDGTIYATNGDEFMMAFAAERYDDARGLSDQKYIKWVAAYWVKTDNVWEIKWFPMYRCTDDDFARFNLPENELVAAKMEKFFDQGHFFCFDYKKFELLIYGAENSGVDFAAFDPMLVPCGSQITLYDGSIIGGGDECVYEPEGITDYMGNQYNMIQLFNQMELDTSSFDENRIKHTATINSQYT